uniref:Uncharacterized protein n=1 Tax=Pavo cristatus TaxID=9049 RepID=A0A8C9F8Q2_PAVCR
MQNAYFEIKWLKGVILKSTACQVGCSLFCSVTWIPLSELILSLQCPGLPDVAEDTVSPTRARTMKDYENVKGNEGRVKEERKKKELGRKEWKNLKAVESLAQGGDAEIQRVKEEAQKKLQEMEGILTGRINLLEEVSAAQEEVEKAIAMAEKEKALRIVAEQKLSSVTNAPARDLDVIVGAEKGRLIEQLNLSLKSKEAVIQHLEEENSRSRPGDGNSSAERLEELTIALRHEKDSEVEVRKLLQLLHRVNLTWSGILRVLCVAVRE